MGPLARTPLGHLTAHRLLLPGRLILAAIVASCWLAACGGDDDPDTPATESASPSPTATAPRRTATPTPTPLADAFDRDLAIAHLRELTLEIGPRPAGSANEHAAAEYLSGTLADYGYEAELQEFTLETYVERVTELDLITPEARPLAAIAIAGSASGTVTGEVVNAGAGTAEDLIGAGGRIALVERGGISYEQKVRNAADAGATAVIIYDSEGGVVSQRLYNLAGIPAVQVSREEGLALTDLIAGGPVSARLVVEGSVADSVSYNVVARESGTVCRAVVGGHYDSVFVGPGANDNGSGTVVVLEMARILAARDETDGVCIALFGAEEAGLIGSEHYVSALSEADQAALEVMLNFDMLGVGDLWSFIGTTGLVSAAGDAAEALGTPYEMAGELKGAGSDHASFETLGIPVLMFNCFCDPNYHQPTDLPDFIRPERLEQAAVIGLAVLEGTLSEPAN